MARLPRSEPTDPVGPTRPGGDEVVQLVERAHREHWSQVLAGTVRVTGDLDLAQECAQEAYLRALRAWPGGVPDVPVAWLTTTARRIALDGLRRADLLRRKLPLLMEPGQRLGAAGSDSADDSNEADEPTDVLRLMFICCHPALAPDSRVALTLRLVGGLSTEEVATGLLVPVATAAARITRAKKKIAGAGIPFRVPSPAELPERLDTLLTVLQVMSAAGHTSVAGTLQRSDLTDRAVRAARLLVAALPDPVVDEARALLGHLLLTRARGDSRTDADGRLVLLADQDRTSWQGADLEEGLDLITAVLTSITTGGRSPGRFTVQAVIAGLHMNAASFSETDWPELVRWYEALLRRWPTPVVRLNALVARSHLPGARRPELRAELAALEREPQLARYPYLPAVVAELLSRWGDLDGAALAYDRAIELSRNDVERQHLRVRRDAAHRGRATAQGPVSDR